ncbi:MAG: MarR family transcriptional regulator [Proteobacteria bacterium]|nr:MarR family transcriptional regulator [Pseudomonadota bacterium]
MVDVADVEAMVRAVPADRKPELRLWLRMLSCANLISADVRQRLRSSYGLTLPQFDLMAQLYREPEGLRLSDLSRRMMVSNGNLTGIVERLAEERLLTREAMPTDRRAFVVCLTETGRAEFAKVANAHEKWIKNLFAEMDEHTLASLTRDLGLLKASVQQGVEP